jgi:hypothetical protein
MQKRKTRDEAFYRCHARHRPLNVQIKGKESISFIASTEKTKQQNEKKNYQQGFVGNRNR